MLRSRVALAVAFFALAVPSYAYRTTVWIPSWDPNAVTIMQQEAGAVVESNPGWYTVNADGSIAKNAGAEDPNLRAAMSGTVLVPTIKNYINGSFNGALVANIIGDATLRETHANALTNLVVTNAYDGIDVDYERIPTTSAASYTAFIQLLAGKLHQAGKKLSVTVSAKTSASQNWDGPGAEDYPSLGAAADFIKIMAYDYHWSTSVPGDLAPLSWLDSVTTYAQSVITPSKVILGLPWYGYDWRGSTGATVTYATAMSTATANGATISHDTDGEATFVYADHTVYFQDASAYQKKVDYVKSRHPGIGGFAHWRVGAEDAATWPIVAALKNGSSITPLTPDFTISGPTSMNVTAGSSASAAFGITPINGFTGNASATATILDSFAGSASLSSPIVAAGGSATLTVAASGAAIAGSYRVQIEMTSGSLVHSQIVTVNVGAAAQSDFAISAPPEVSVAAGSNTTAVVSLHAVNGFTGNANLTAQMLDFFSGSVTPTTSAISATSPVTITIAPSSKAAVQRYRLQITATAGSISHATTIDVDVTAPAKKRALRH